MSDIVQTMPEGPFEATSKTELERQIMDPNTPKMEREWWAASEITTLRAEVERLKAALKPFAEYGAAGCWHWIDVETPVSLVVEPHIVWLKSALKVWDFRNARTALEEKP